VPNLFRRIASVAIEALDKLISLFVRAFKWPEPKGLTRNFLRACFAIVYLAAIVQSAASLSEIYESGELLKIFRFLREHHPLVVALPVVLAFFLLTAFLASFRSMHKGAYGFCEFMVGTISGLGLFLIVIRSEKPMSDTEWIVAICGSLYLAAEGLSILTEAEGAKSQVILSQAAKSE
jgi:hypothetical protein